LIYNLIVGWILSTVLAFISFLILDFKIYTYTEGELGLIFDEGFISFVKFFLIPIYSPGRTIRMLANFDAIKNGLDEKLDELRR
jgi:hypothetical protein